MIVRIQVDRDVLRLGGPAVGRDLRRRLGAIATRAGRRLGLSTAQLRMLGVRIVGDATMIDLHRRHLGSARPTDVLSFPADDAGLGDIAIDWPQVCRQAQGDVLAEAAQLVVHGLVHLIGHDHGCRPDARRMFRAERRAARSAAIAPPVRPYGGAA